jgi:signal transduction histidine kinase
MTKILIVDDMDEIRHLLSQVLQFDDYETVEAENGPRALQLAASEAPDAILLDLMMPGMDGIEVCRRLKSDPQLRAIPVIMLTAKGAEEDVVNGLDAGADDYVTKPFRNSVLSARLRSAVRTKQAHDSMAQLNLQLQDQIAQRKLMEAELARAHRLESIGKLADGIAHEINTPIQYIGDNLSFVQQAFQTSSECLSRIQRIAEDPQLNQVAETIARELNSTLSEIDAEYLFTEVPRALQESLEGAADISRIVHSMSDFAQSNGGNKISTDVNRCIQHTITVCRHEWKNVADIVTDLAAELPLFFCIPCEISEVIQQLLLNASQAISDASLESPQAKGIITIRTCRENENIVLEVQDSGVGIPENIRDRIFDPFFTTREVGKGTGQGLAICHSIIVAKYSGNIFCESQLGKGTKFTISLPISTPAELSLSSS